jgi:Cytochrome c7 and related cytochrome c
MTHWKKRIIALAIPIAVSGLAIVATQVQAEEPAQEEAFPLGTKWLLPFPLEDRVAYGNVSDEVLPQPIAYSHKLHAGELQIDCQYCHYNARRSIHAGVPPTETCMNCHKMVDPTGRPELEKLKEFWESGEPIPWNKVHDLPDWVYFSHKRHVSGGVTCQECHGDVAKDFTVGRRVSQLTMGWCLDCHSKHPKVDENYGADAELRRAELKDCWTCHK